MRLRKDLEQDLPKAQHFCVLTPREDIGYTCSISEFHSRQGASGVLYSTRYTTRVHKHCLKIPGTAVLCTWYVYSQFSHEPIAITYLTEAHK